MIFGKRLKNSKNYTSKRKVGITKLLIETQYRKYERLDWRGKVVEKGRRKTMVEE